MDVAQTDRPVLYTAIFGGKDGLIDDHCGLDDWRMVCFTDNPALRSDRVEILVVPPICADPVRCARYYKLLPHVHLPNSSMSVWVDGSVRIVAEDFTELVDGWLAEAPVATVRHRRRTCVYEEARQVIRLGKDDPRLVRRQVKEYRSMGVPRNLGLHVTSIMCRRHLSDDVRRLSAEWWDLVVHFSRRDQISFDVARWKTQCNVYTIPHPTTVTSPPWFVQNDHAVAADFGSHPPLPRRVLDRGRASALRFLSGIFG